DDLDRDNWILDFLQGLENSFQRSWRVGLDHQVELFDRALLGPPSQLLERDPRRTLAACLGLAPLQQLGQCDLAGGLLGAPDLEDVAGAGHLAQPADANRPSR